MFGTDIVMLPERKGNRMNSDIDTARTRALGWEPKENLKDYIEKLLL
jgi:UDP-glucose 4-epimerase